jgi:hypothetical protein
LELCGHRRAVDSENWSSLAPTAIEFILDVERKRNPAAAKLKAESFFDETFIDELRKEGY